MSKIKTNTSLHLSDKADSVFIDKEGTVWEDNESVITVQDALETIEEQAINLIKATDKEYGVVKIANEEDLSNYIGTGDVVTSQQMFDYNSKPEATYEIVGTTRYATESEVNEKESETTSVNPKQLHLKFEHHNAKVDQYGTIKLSDESMVIPGINNDTAMTPKLVKMAIDSLVPEVAVATEDVSGTVTLADINSTLDGNIRIGYAVSPWSFSRANGNESKAGTVQMATVSQARQGTERDKYVISPYTFKNTRASTSSVGTVQLATEAEVKAKSNNDKAVTPKSLKYYSDLIEKNSKEILDLRNKIDNLERGLESSSNEINNNANDISSILRRLNELESSRTIASKGTNGYYEDKHTGIIIQWGTVDYTWNVNGEVSVNFNKTFPNYCLNVQLTRKTGWADQHGKAGALLISQSRDHFKVALNKFNESQTGTARGFTWFAVGY